MIGRREILLGGSLFILAGIPRTCLCAGGVFGCSITRDAAQAYLSNEEAFDPRRDKVVTRSGNKDFDFAAAQTLSRLSDTFEVLPGFAFFNIGPSRNAFACEELSLGSRYPDGVVLFGRDLLFEVMNYTDGPDTAFSAICAHEFGHILQFKLGLMERLNRGQASVKRAELHADFLAGYFAGLRKLERPSFKAAVYADTQHKFGDFATGASDHHGTPQERADAIVQGFKTAFNERRNLNEAVAMGMRYVSRT
jgi:hypothetical protein